ncbi:MAG: MFS transporter [Actinomyces sp.]|nr:MFS transporter [Actinomyces sp.]MCI1641885.1 MFS transporter [Actinomyces sp.]MCI1661898.1 MFS transporter [Actinomyces sp.]MCI1691270.1 MFS transporter [Actinomyces sp.]MCI1787701.1 MFS transporter [Actinomyces sp.]MCI1830392.1 MFS transporter [Actinomyces sp.]
MTDPYPDQVPATSAAAHRVNPSAAFGEDSVAAASPATTTIRTPVPASYIWFLLLANFGVFMAVVAPVGVSLALRVQEIAPDNVEVLGFVVGAGAAVAAISQPLVGMWSDRTRSHLGRRRPFSIGGALLGFLALAFIAGAPSIPLLVVGWMLGQLGWTTVTLSLLLSQADRLPEEQRGKVAGLNGVCSMIASVVGVTVASAFIGSNYLVFLVPGTVGLAFSLLWAMLIPESSTQDADFGPRPKVGKIFANMVFKPAQYPDFAWNWLGRLLFNFGVTFATTFTTLFFASRLTTSGQVADLGPLVPIISIAGVIATAGGAFGGGFLSDKLKRRRIFVLLAGIAFTVGALIMCFGGSNLGVLITGSVIMQLGLGVFSAVDQAIVLDVLPGGDTEAGRFMGIIGYSTAIAQALAPIIAVPLLLIGVTGTDKNYGLLLVIAAGCALIGGLIILTKVRGTK